MTSNERKWALGALILVAMGSLGGIVIYLGLSLVAYRLGYWSPMIVYGLVPVSAALTTGLAMAEYAVIDAIYKWRHKDDAETEFEGDRTEWPKEEAQ